MEIELKWYFAFLPCKRRYAARLKAQVVVGRQVLKWGSLRGRVGLILLVVIGLRWKSDLENCLFFLLCACDSQKIERVRHRNVEKPKPK
jgi:hypothetical protein